ncbi:hypothetical protein [Ureibacillus sp. GCM10028918]|uniref:hypothetical protein n=1 Tax=Ureibacillus sp. GCM10028918 TaxID=3273429 RepID=UPI003617E5FE
MKKNVVSLCLLLFIAGCSNGEQTEPSNKISSHNFLPPPVHFQIEDTTYTTEQGSYCWRNVNSAECLSVPSPTEIVESTEPIKVTKKKTISILTLRPPSQQTLTITNADSNQSEEFTINKENKFKAPDTEGVYIIAYYAIWEKDDSGTSGDSTFVFKIEVDK